VPVNPNPREAAPVAPSVVEGPATASNAPNEALYWALGGGALLLLGLGGAAAFRRRRTDEEVLAVAPTAPVAAEPVVTERVPVVEPGVQRAPATAYTPTMPAPHIGSLEAMAAAPPSPENPFLTHSRRMRRARFLLAQAERRDAALHTPTVAPEPPQTIHAEPKMQTVYRLGGDRGRQMGFKPQTR
jgi:MYXO-CTERM domain-containing protein